MAKKQVTFADIAEYTGFSKTTISRYFNHPDSLTLENQEKIAKALDELGYRKNKLARVLANGKSEFVGIIVPNLYLHYYSEMLTQLLRSYSDYHYKFLVFVSDGGPEKEMQYLDELMAYKIEGLIVLSHTLSSEKLASYNIPVIAIEREAERYAADPIGYIALTSPQVKVTVTDDNGKPYQPKNMPYNPIEREER